MEMLTPIATIITIRDTDIGTTIVTNTSTVTSPMSMNTTKTKATATATHTLLKTHTQM